VLFNIETGKETVFHEFRNVHGVGYRWGKDSSTLFFKEHTRGYQQMNIYNYNLREGIKKRIYHETSSTNIDNFESDFSAFDSTIILITSERSGWRQLYLQSQNEEHLVPLTQGEYFINNVVHLNKTTREVYFTASGKESDNPYHQYLYKVNINTKKVTLLTPEKGNHEITFSRDYNYFIDNISALDLPTQTVLKKTNDGAILQPLTKADVSELTKANYPFPAAFSAIGRDGKTTIYGAMWKPSNFDPQKKYPVIDNSYTGPHTFVFPNRFNKGLTSANQALAELGFIVVVIDGMGTANRSKSFHNVSYKNMGKNLTDHVIAIQYLAKKYKYIDDTRVGIFGHSAGGYDAGHALLEFPDFYKVGVASSADHDFRMEKDWWPEMYMGWPVDSSYHAVSNITMAPNLKGKLLLVHGGIDENVNPSATFKLAEALIKADKEFDLLIIPSQRHGYNGKYNDYFTKKKWNYFVEHLLGKKPIWEVNLRQ
jgi:dipeptidyl aminopeptidase/acylaminoacyl peptidase